MHPDLPQEQAYFDRAADLRDRLEANLDRAASLAADPQTSADLRRRVGAMGVVDPSQAVAFGRIDVDGKKWYIGRGAIWDENDDLLVVNWQAPIAAPFYTATPEDPQGLDARRIYRCRDNRILDIDEMVFNGVATAVRNGEPPRRATAFDNEADESDEADEVLGDLDELDALDQVDEQATGSLPAVAVAPSTPRITDALLESLGRERSGTLSDIVATIQAEQYDVVTRDAEQLLIVQGGPGTGKTVIGLHRVSWLLFNRREQMQANDVLIVGPNPAFLRYVSAVLPALGEGAVVQLPLVNLGPRVPIDRVDPLEVRRLKGDRRMLRLLLRAVRNRQRIRRGAVEFSVEGRRIEIEGDRMLARARQVSGHPHNEARRALRAFLIDEARRQLEQRGLHDPAAPKINLQGDAVREIDTLLDRVWPNLTPQGFLFELFSNRSQLDAAAAGVLSDEETELLVQPKDSGLSARTWAVDEVPLLDLADALLNGAAQTYEHVVVDEAQDLSPMQFESVRRRSRHGWMTVLGDLAQATSPWAPTSWEEVALHLRRDRVPTEIAELTLGYRLPAEVHEVAMRLLPEIAPGLHGPESLRASGHPVMVLPTEPEGLADEVMHALRSLPSTGLVGVIAAAQDRPAITEAMDAEGLSWSPELDAAAAPITVVGPEGTKGLEFDHVVVVEPAHITAESPQGLRALFVAMTRPTSRLAVVHAEPLPEVLRLRCPPPEPEPEPEVADDPEAAFEPEVDLGPYAEPSARFEPEAAFEPEPEVAYEVRGGREPEPELRANGNIDLRSAGPQPQPQAPLAPPAPGSLGALDSLDREMARAIAATLAQALTRCAMPNLVPMVVEELTDLLHVERDH